MASPAMVPSRFARGLGQQEDRVLRGQQYPMPEVFEEKHIWSVYHFTAGSAPNPIQSNTLQANDYVVFTTAQGQNGQGLPSGFQLDPRDTNFAGQGGNIPAGYNYIWRELGISVLAQRPDVAASIATSRQGPPSMHDTDQILNGTAVILRRNSADVNLGCAAWYSQAGGPVNVGTTILDEAAAAGAVAGPPAYTTGGLAIDTAGNYQERWSANSGGLPPAPMFRRKLEVPLIFRGQDQFLVVLRIARPILLNTVLQGGTNGFSVRVDFFGVESSPVGRT